MFIYLFFMSIFARLFMFGSIPDGINCDEAYAGYEAYSILHSSLDSWGKKFPLYFITGGGGTNVLYSYLSIPFIALFDLEPWVIRLPQVILSLLSCYIFYKLLQTIYNKNTAYIGLFIISIMPWHIILSRWGFHGNIAPAFCLIAFYFYCLTINNIKFIWLSLLFYGLGCYTYDPTIGYILGIIPILLSYLTISSPKKDKKFWLHLTGASLIFLLIIAPIISLWIINHFDLNEYNGKYFSIPKLPGWRGSEININNIKSNSSILLNLLLKQSDNMIWNTINKFGLFYYISTPFIIIGLASIVTKSIKELKNKIFSYNFCILLQFIYGILYATLFAAHSSNRVNFLFFPLTIFITMGISHFYKYKKIFLSILATFLIYFAYFEIFYFRNYNKLAQDNFSIEFSKALKEADKQHKITKKDIHILQHESDTVKILFYNKIDNIEYQKTVIWKNYPSSYLQAKSFLHYSFFTPYDNINITDNAIYIAPSYTKQHFINTLKDIQIKTFNKYIVVF